MTAPTTRPLICFAALALAACQTTTEPAEPVAPPPYPPGYAPAGSRIPDVITQRLPEDITPAQVLIADDGCYYYHRGARVFLVKAEDGQTRFCLDEEPVTQPVDLSGVTL